MHTCSVCVGTHALTCAHLLSVCWDPRPNMVHLHCRTHRTSPPVVPFGLVPCLGARGPHCSPLGWAKECESCKSDLRMECDTLDTQRDVLGAQVSDSVCVCVRMYVAVMDASSIDLCEVCSLTTCSVSVCVSVGLLKQAMPSS